MSFNLKPYIHSLIHSLVFSTDASLHDVLNYLLALEEQNQGTIYQKRDHGKASNFSSQNGPLVL